MSEVYDDYAVTAYCLNLSELVRRHAQESTLLDRFYGDDISIMGRGHTGGISIYGPVFGNYAALVSHLDGLPIARFQEVGQEQLLRGIVQLTRRLNPQAVQIFDMLYRLDVTLVARHYSRLRGEDVNEILTALWGLGDSYFLGAMSLRELISGFEEILETILEDSGPEARINRDATRAQQRRAYRDTIYEKRLRLLRGFLVTLQELDAAVIVAESLV